MNLLDIRFDIKRIRALKELMIRLRHGESVKVIQKEFNQQFNDVKIQYILLMEQQLMSEKNDITVDDVKRFTAVHDHLFDRGKLEAFPDEHPIAIFLAENVALRSVLDRFEQLFIRYENEEHHDVVEKLHQQIFRVGALHAHYHRKEKLFFPIMEREGHHMPTRMMWREDDRVRALYQAAKRKIDELPNAPLNHVKKTYDAFAKACQDMIFQEEAILLPVLMNIFSETDWFDIAGESDALSYTLIDHPGQRKREGTKTWQNHAGAKHVIDSFGNIRFGGGYLTIEEANLILNHLPLEITFVDKNSVFKYFNEMTEASDMMLVRTPLSIGRNVANCHPPKSLKKVINLIRDLKTGKRASECMWFKKGDQYVHITYKALFNDAGEYVGILEYVQDIQPFLQLPSKIKTDVSELKE